MTNVFDAPVANPFNATKPSSSIPISPYDQVKTPAPATFSNKAPVNVQQPFTQNPIADNQPAAKALVSKIFPALPDLAHGLQTGDWAPYVQKLQSGPSIHDLASGTPAGKQALMNYVLGVVNPEGELGGELGGAEAAMKSPIEGQPHVEEPIPVSPDKPSTPESPSKDPLGASLQELNQNRKISEPLPETVPTDHQYVKQPNVDVTPQGTDKATARNLRTDYAGVKNEQIVRGNQLADEIRAAAPKEQDGMFWYKAAQGDTKTLEGLLENPKFEEYKPGIEQALKLSPEAKAALAKGDQYYKEAGAVAKNTGTISSIREQYQNRIYEQDPAKDFVKTEMAQGLKQTTSHAKGRVFDNEIQAIEAGKKFATTNYADALSIHNEEMARVNTARNLMDNMEKGGLGAWTDRVPGNWQQVGQLRKGTQVFAAPKGIADGLKAITDPDFLKKVDAVNFLQKYQGLAKSVDLAFSFFHHLTFVTQTISSKRGLTTLAQMVTGGLKMEAPAFKAMELDFVRSGGMTTKVSSTQDIMHELSKGSDNISMLLQLPVGKQINAAMEASNKFLFEKMQRFIKVMTYQKNMASWVAKNPTATDAAVMAAKRGYAKATNAEFGGLNWQAMGVTKSNQSILRTLFLAPDWLTSAGAQTKYALSDTGTAGQQARLTLVKAIVGGMAVTEGINKLITGHYTDQNPPGHTMEIEVAPNVYVSLIRGAPGELVKFISNIAQSGGQGAFQYTEGKLAPLARTGLGLASGVNYYGQSIWQGGKHPTAISKTFGGLMFILENATPIPFGLSATAQELGSSKMTPVGVAATATGVGRFSAPSTKKAAANPFSM